jgi:hypothetical protein
VPAAPAKLAAVDPLHRTKKQRRREQGRKLAELLQQKRARGELKKSKKSETKSKRGEIF